MRNILVTRICCECLKYFLHGIRATRWRVLDPLYPLGHPWITPEFDPPKNILLSIRPHRMGTRILEYRAGQMLGEPVEFELQLLLQVLVRLA